MTRAPRVVVIPPEDAGERLDKVLARLLAGDNVSRSAITQCFAAGRVTSASHALKPSERARAGLTVTVDVPPPAPMVAVAEDIPLTIVFEDEHLLIIDKPPGMVVHPSRGHAGGTLVNAVLHHADVDEDGDPLRPGIVHRIDRDTSGLLVVARSTAARDGLVARFKAHDIERSYVALVEGVAPAEVTYDTWHGRHPTDRLRFTSRGTGGKRAITHVERVESFGGGVASMVRCRLETGRTHQIRVHLTEAGHPLLGDVLYGRTVKDPAARAIAAALGRQALHAEVLGFTHPVSGEALRFSAPPPADFAAALDALRALPLPAVATPGKRAR
ncbi:MAG: RluA family pseudouridine synthase [Deltaproteobacteria bacterium]|nr:RluA family pseudouridine synthase [Myxococcales bacterium]MDP3218350.1 RluA family pseudouridine synthase [Deltaproteobacteria bacterium]